MKLPSRAWLALGVVLAGCWSAPSAWSAADPGVSTTVEPIPTAVTLRRGDLTSLPLNTLAAYRVTMVNNTTNVLNRVFFTGTAANVGGTDLVAYDSAQAATCAAGATPNIVNCSLGSLAPGGSTQFLVVYRAPTTGQRIDLNWSAGGFEGNGGGNGCCAQPGTAQTTLVDPTTDPSYRVSLKSFVKQGGGAFYTGNQAVVTDGTKNTPDDPFATLITVPSAATSSRGQITETVETCNGLPNCYRSTIAITSVVDGTLTQFPASPYLKVVLRLDASKVRNTRIENVLLFYTGGAFGQFVEQPIPDCASGPVPTGTGLPCVVARKVYKGSDGQAFNGDFEWTLINTENGSIKIFP